MYTPLHSLAHSTDWDVPNYCILPIKPPPPNKPPLPFSLNSCEDQNFHFCHSSLPHEAAKFHIVGIFKLLNSIVSNKNHIAFHKEMQKKDGR